MTNVTILTFSLQLLSGFFYIDLSC